MKNNPKNILAETGISCKSLSEALLESKSLVMITDFKGMIKYCNKNYLKLTGYSQENIIGKKASILSSGNTPTQTYKYLWNTIKNGKVWKGEFCNKKKNNSIFWEEATIIPVDSHDNEQVKYIKISQDISSTKKIEEIFQKMMRKLEKTKHNLIQNNSIMKSVLDSASEVMIYAIDENYKYIIFNQAHENFMKKLLDADIAVGKNVLDYVKDNNFKKELKKRLDYALSGHVRKTENKYYLSNRYQYFDCQYYPIKNFDQIVGVTAFLVNITGLKEKEDKLNYHDKLFTMLFHFSSLVTKEYSLNAIRHKIIPYIGKLTKSSRAFVFKNISKNGILYAQKEYMWYSSKIKKKEELKKIDCFPYHDLDLNDWRDRLYNKQTISGNIGDFSEKTKTFFKVLDMKSIAIVPIFIRDKWWGFLGVDDVFKEREWKRTTLDALTISARIIGNTINNSTFIKNLEKSKNKIQSILNTVPYLLITVDKNCNIKDYNHNKKFIQKFKLNKKSNLKQIFNKSIIHEIKNLINESIKNEKLMEIEVEVEELDEYFEFRINPLNKDKVLVIIREITDQVFLTRDLIESKEKAEKSDSIKTQFLANMSHELRTPLNAILNYSSFGKKRVDKVPKNKIERYFNQINISGQRLLDLFNNLIDLSKIESNNLSFNMKKNDLAVIVHNVISEFESYLDQKNIEFITNQSFRNLEIECDQLRISQVFRNIISNAIKFTPKNKKIIIENSSKIKNEQSYIQIDVIDQGIGIPENELETIFEKFTQSSRTTDGTGGTGLGLAITKNLVTAHKGNITATTNKYGGTTISVILPLQQTKKN